LLLVGESNNIEEFPVFLVFRKTSSGLCLEHTEAGGAKAANYVPLAVMNPDPRKFQPVVSA
jgi:hypothetical protein